MALGGEFEASSVSEHQIHLGNSHGLAGGAAQAIAWRPALRAAMFLAIPAGVLSSNLSALGASLALVWMVSAAVWAVALYGRQMRPSRLTKGVGARIGLITGLFACWVTLALNGVNLWVSRFLFHQNVRLDSEWSSFVDQNIQFCQSLYTQMGVNPALLQQLETERGLMLSAEGRAGFLLFGFVFSATFLVLFSTIGGAVGARFVTHSNRTRS